MQDLIWFDQLCHLTAHLKSRQERFGVRLRPPECGNTPLLDTSDTSSVAHTHAKLSLTLTQLTCPACTLDMCDVPIATDPNTPYGIHVYETKRRNTSKSYHCLEIEAHCYKYRVFTIKMHEINVNMCKPAAESAHGNYIRFY